MNLGPIADLAPTKLGWLRRTEEALVFLVLTINGTDCEVATSIAFLYLFSFMALSKPILSHWP